MAQLKQLSQHIPWTVQDSTKTFRGKASDKFSEEREALPSLWPTPPTSTKLINFHEFKYLKPRYYPNPSKPPDNLMSIQSSDDNNNPVIPNATIPLTFKEKLIGHEGKITISTDSLSTLTLPMDIQEEETNSYPNEGNENFSISVPITLEDKQRIYYPWKFSLIIKLHGKRILHQILK